MNSKIKQWVAVAISEIIISLILIAIAPNFLNSKKPFFGFLIWFTVPTVIGSSSIYAANKLIAANKARTIFVTAFPKYSYLKTTDFIDLSPQQVASQISLLASIQESAIEDFNISLFEILEQTNNEKN